MQVQDSAPGLSSNTFCLAFSFEHLSNKKDFSLDGGNKKDKVILLSTLGRLSKMRWQEIQTQGKHQQGHEKIKRESLKDKIPDHIKEDATFIAFRAAGMKSMVGYRDNKIFFILWIDWKFKLYDHG